MNDDHNLITELILKYARGEVLTAGEANVLEAWRAQSEDNRELPDLFRNKPWVEEKLRQMPPVPEDEIWEMIRQRMGMDPEDAPVGRRRWFSPVGIAAVLVLLLGIGASLFYRMRQKRLGRTAPEIAQVGMPGHYRSVLSLDDGSLQVTDSSGWVAPFDLRLPDGSTARLCYGSTLRYAPSFDGQTRDVYLNGQAVFDVVDKKDMPFVVHSGLAAVRVLGTCFNVLGYADEPACEVTLLRGKVAVEQEGVTRVLKPSEQAIVKEGRMTIRTLVHPEGSTGWGGKDPYFEFNNADLNTVVRRMARWYRKKVSNPEQVTGVSVTGIFRQQDPLNTNLARLGDAERWSARVESRNDTIFLSPDGPPPASK